VIALCDFCEKQKGLALCVLWMCCEDVPLRYLSVLAKVLRCATAKIRTRNQSREKRRPSLLKETWSGGGRFAFNCKPRWFWSGPIFQD
jgi:hypothetical protein